MSLAPLNVRSLHTMHTCMWSKVDFIGIKLDMSKVYD